MTPKREFKPRRRASSFRDAKLIVIAAEGTETEERYFEDLAAGDAYRNRRVHVEILKRPTTASSPDHIIEQLDAFRKEYKLKQADELWMVIDFDRWGNRKLSRISTQCMQKQYLLAVSNPCFELWLLLHIKSLDEYTDTELKELAANEKVNRARTRLEIELSRLLGGYDKSNLDSSRFIPFIEVAIGRAKALDILPQQRWPTQIGTRVYKLAESIIASASR